MTPQETYNVTHLQTSFLYRANFEDLRTARIELNMKRPQAGPYLAGARDYCPPPPVPSKKRDFRADFGQNVAKRGELDLEIRASQLDGLK
ncbi:MAG: hypothetical protein MJA29_09075, partial [Candidatus Omnitrophica bacterium]|nr:hypothetical protein [Candidatus Omnitrophota bacterium]